MMRHYDRRSVVRALFATLGVVVILEASASDLEFGSPIPVHGPFQVPAGLGIDRTNGRVLVADTGNHQVQWAPLGSLETGATWTAFGSVADLSLPEALREPQAVAVDGAGNAYVVDTHSNEVQLYRFDAGTGGYAYDATFAQTTRNSVDGTDIRFPRDIAVASDGTVFLLDSGNDRILTANGPDDDSWELWRSDAAWGNPYGLDVRTDNSVVLADTDNHRILILPPGGGAATSFGSFGTRSDEFRSPRDIAVAGDGRLFVADTYNHRIVVLEDDGDVVRTLGSAPTFATLQKIAIDGDDHIYVVDSDRERLVAYLGPGVPPAYDAYLRDYVGDAGMQPSDSVYALSSPDILIRRAPDVDPTVAISNGLESIAFQQPRVDESSFVYVAVRNRGLQDMHNVSVALHWARQSSTLDFPDGWSQDGMYTSYIDDALNEPGSRIYIPTIPGSSGGIDGQVVVGPIVWRPPAPIDDEASSEAVYLLARAAHIDDPTQLETGLAQVRLNNNMAIRDAVASRGPAPIGDQDTLVIRADFPDVSGSADESTVQTRVAMAGELIRGWSYDQVEIKPAYIGPLAIPNPTTHYEDPTRSLLIDMATDLLAAVPASTLNGATADPADDIDRIVIVVNETTFTRDWATTGLWPYEHPDGVRFLSVSVQGPDNDAELFAHGLAHQLGLEDLLIHEGVDFGLGQTADGWDSMAEPINGVHPLVWSKEKATWLTSTLGDVRYIPRPPVSSPRTGEPAIPLHYQTVIEENEIGAIAIGLTEGRTTLESEHHFYWIEARSDAVGSLDPVPDEGVLVYWAHALIPQGEGPVIVRDSVVSTDGIHDAPLDEGDSMEIPGTGIVIEVDSEMPDSEGFNILVDYIPPPEDYDVHIRVGDPHWHSPDIWVDNQRDGGYASYDSVNHLSSGPVDEPPLPGVENRIFARVHNAGPAPAFNVEVRFEMSEPYHTVGGEGSFDERAIRFIPEVPPGEYRDVFFVWEPDSDQDPHNCVRVVIRRLINDIDENNNEAQQNLNIEVSASSSPFDPVDFNFQIRNENEEETQLVYFRDEGVPDTWSKSFPTPKRLLAPLETFVGNLIVQPPDDALICTDQNLFVTAWTPQGDTLVQLGGTTVDVQLRDRTELQLTNRLIPCGHDPKDFPHLTLQPGAFAAADPVTDPAEAPATANGGSTIVDPADVTASSTTTVAEIALPSGPRMATRIPPVQLLKCAVAMTGGCTNPPRPNERIVLEYRDPAGNPIYKEVVTDEFGCFEDFQTFVEGGPWEATAHYPGDDCSAPATATVDLDIPVVQTGDQDHDGVSDEDETQGDDDGDGRPNHLDPDSDNDGRPDGSESGEDTDGDGLVDQVDPDSDEDGVLDGDEPPGDADNDGLDNGVDPDSDNDGIPDGDDPSPYQPGDCDMSAEQAYWWHVVVAALLLIAVLLYLFAYWVKLWRPGIIAIALALSVALIGLYVCYQAHLGLAVVILIVVIVAAALLRYRVATP